MKVKVLTQCEVCGTETDCTETRNGAMVCSSTCKRLLEGNDHGIVVPLDAMFLATESLYYCKG